MSHLLIRLHIYRFDRNHQKPSSKEEVNSLTDYRCTKDFPCSDPLELSFSSLVMSCLKYHYVTLKSVESKRILAEMQKRSWNSLRTSNQCRDLKRSTIFCRFFPLKSEWFPAKDWVFHTCFIADVMPPHLALGASIFLPHKDDGRGQPVEPGKVVDCNSLPQIAPVRFPLDWGVNSPIFSCNLH